MDSAALQNDVCRCCLLERGSYDVTAASPAATGRVEVYCDMLRECYGIILSHLTNRIGTSRMVCQHCVEALRGAAAFRKQVMDSERRFASIVDSRSDDGKKSPNSVQSQTHTPHRRKKCTTAKVKTKKFKVNNSNIEGDGGGDDDDDKPLNKFIKEIEPQDVEVKTDIYVDNNYKDRQYLPNVVKQVSERKRVMMTCDTVIRETTACPFRHQKSWFQCFFCQQDFMKISLLREHTLKNHHDTDEELKKIKRYPRTLQIEISNMECRHCNCSLTDVSSMCHHFSEIHKKVVYNECIADFKVDASPYTCHLCAQEFHVFRTLTTHINEHYANCICDVCGKSFLNTKRLEVHKRTHAYGQFPCHECGKIFKTKISKANHVEGVHSKRAIKCQICLKPMKHYNDRIKHMSEAHDITYKFKCPFCDREYNIKHYLATHIRQTHGNKNKKCLDCGMAFITNYGLKKHMLKHSGVKPHTCAVCYKSYTRSYTLKEHMRAHEKDSSCLESQLKMDKEHSRKLDGNKKKVDYDRFCNN